jgi:hypothetical protein
MDKHQISVIYQKINSYYITIFLKMVNLNRSTGIYLKMSEIANHSH